DNAASTLAIGCGRQAALATRLLRARGAAAVQILDPRIGTRHWDAVIAPEHDGLSGANVITLLGSLHPVEAAWLLRGCAGFAQLDRPPARRSVDLLGGPTRHAPCATVHLDALRGRVLEVRASDGGSVLAPVSRRTPAAIAAMLRRRLAGVPG